MSGGSRWWILEIVLGGDGAKRIDWNSADRSQCDFSLVSRSRVGQNQRAN